MRRTWKALTSFGARAKSLSGADGGPFTALFLLALLLRLFVAASRTDSVWPDEQFQALEPASFVVFGHGFMTWEWASRYRSWLIPALYMPLLWICKCLGIQGGVILVQLCRVFTAALSGWVVVRLNAVMKSLRIADRARFLALAAYAFSVPMILWSATTLGDHWALIAAWATMPAILDRVGDRKFETWLAIGVLSGLPFFFKVQMLTWVFGLFVGFVVLGTPLRLILAAALGCLVEVLAIGALDGVTLGMPFYSWYIQLSRGVEISRIYGTSPLWDYLPRIWVDQGPWIFLALLILGGLPLILPKKAESGIVSSVWNGSPPGRLLWVAFLPGIALFIFHCLIGHKETRFLLPLFPAFYVLLAVLLNRVPLGSWRPSNAILCGTLGVLTVVSGFYARVTPIYLSGVNVSDLEEAVFRDQGLSPEGNSCILLVGNNWAWTRGEMVVGRKVHYVDIDVSNLGRVGIPRCTYAIVNRAASRLFFEAAGRVWLPLRASKLSGFDLFRNAHP